jgi:hypothetical protein
MLFKIVDFININSKIVFIFTLKLMKMKIFPKSTLVYFSILIVGLVSCKKFDDFDKIAKTAWNPNIAAQVGYATFGVYDVLAIIDSSELLIIDPVSGQIGLVYKSEIASYQSEEIVDLGEITDNYEFNISDLNINPSPAFVGQANSIKNEGIQLNVENGIEIHNVKFENGNLLLHLETTLKHDLNVNLRFPGLLENGVPIQRNFTFNYTGSVPQVSDLSISLSNVDGDFTVNGTTTNRTNVIVTTQVNGTGESVDGNETLTLDLNSANIEYLNVQGYFGQQQISQQTADSVLIKIFQNATEGHFELNDPKVNFKIENSFGFPVDISLSNLKTINPSSGVITLLQGFPNVLNVAYPTVLGESEESNLLLTSANTSNLSSLISPTPKYFYYELAALSNPNGPSADLNFIENDSRFTLTAEVDMPLDGLAYGFSISDTVDYDFTDNPTEIESIMFRLITNNGFPVNLGTQIKALDENNNELFSIFDTPEYVVQSAPVNIDGIAEGKTKKISDLILDEEKVSLISLVKKFVIYGELSTKDYQNSTYVKFLDSYTIDLKLAVQVQIKTSF